MTRYIGEGYNPLVAIHLGGGAKLMKRKPAASRLHNKAAMQATEIAESTSLRAPSA